MRRFLRLGDCYCLHTSAGYALEEALFARRSCESYEIITEEFLRGTVYLEELVQRTCLLLILR